MGVGYSASQLEDHSPVFPSQMLSPELQRSPTLWLAMKEHLCQMLAHHLIFVGSMLGIKLDTGLEQRIIDTAVSRWNKAESFVWANAVDPGKDSRHASLEPVESSSSSSGVAKTENRDVVLGNQEPPPWSNPLSRSPPGPPKLVPISCPDVARFQPRNLDQWSENPQSWLSMCEEPDSYASNGSDSATSEKRALPPMPDSDFEPRYSHQGMLSLLSWSRTVRG